MQRKLSSGLDVDFTEDVEESLSLSSKFGYDFICSNIVRQGCVPFHSARLKDKIGGVTETEFLYNSQEWSSRVVGKISSFPHLSSVVANKRLVAEESMIQELRFATFLCLPAVIIEITKENFSNVAGIIYSFLQEGHPDFDFWIKIPLQFSECNDDTWQWWNKFRSLCNHHNQVGVALELTPNLPSQLERWSGEPIRMLSISTSLFASNKHGKRELARSHQDFVTNLFKTGCRITISGYGATDESDAIECNNYLNQLFRNSKDKIKYKQIADGSQNDDFVSPLQPLRDNLESSVYQCFEKYPTKYAMYEEAVRRCLIDRVPYSEADSRTTVIMVLGCGRGPLVRMSVSAAKEAKRRVRIYAVEKNKSAYVFLQHLKSTLWKDDDLTVVNADMRTWEAPELADIVVSEMLGSFADDELSPECLDGTNRILKPDAVNIPQSYTSFISPISSHRMYNEMRKMATCEGNKSSGTAFDTPHLLRFHNYHELTEPAPLFTFTHPNWNLSSEHPKPDFYPDVAPKVWDLKFKQKPPSHDKNGADTSFPLPANSHNTRYQRTAFNIAFNTIVHGFMGYFRCAIYKDVEISIEPQSQSTLLPWNPIFFPLHQPIAATKGSTMEVDFWRRCDGKRVWHEWCAVSPEASRIHNSNGCGYPICL